MTNVRHRVELGAQAVAYKSVGSTYDALAQPIWRPVFDGLPGPRWHDHPTEVVWDGLNRELGP